ncbi:MAG: sulfatase-like hydrolase/transferase, partial [Myxococcales bacterium]
ATLAEVLRGHGYTTFGAAALPQVAAASQRPAGFETFDDAPMYADDAIDSALRVTGAVLSWLRTDRAAPVFVFAHYADPGLPWYYPDNGDDEPYAGPLVQAISRRALKLYGPAMDDADRRYVRGAYAAEVAYADRHLGRLLERLRDTGRYDDALIVVVGDHGMGLGEGAEERPGDLGGIARRHVHVPLVVKLPGGAHAGARAAGPLSLSDLAPALAAQLRVPWPAARTGARAPEPRVLAPEAAGLRRSRGAYRELRSEAQWMQGVRVGHLELMRDLFTGSRVLLQHGGEVPARTLDPDVDPGRTLRLERMLDRHFHSPSEPNAWAIGARPAPHPGGPP